ncbi:MAG TPA: CocE/NonD family hydrolase [Pseudonocardiaceae bacterium]|jgi:hypothetical protein|nr:CocE/NonD family hydrolase [Pseudonocardiaceae bacterium]
MSITEIQQPAPPATDGPEPRYEVELIRDLRIPTDDSDISLSADLFLPVTADPVPATVTILPYRKDNVAGHENHATLRWFAERGFAGLLVDLRGTGSSDGTQFPPFDPREADDAAAVIAWAAAQPWCTGHIGMWGHSYGAILALRTAARRPPDLKAIVPIMGAFDPGRELIHPADGPGFVITASWGMHTLLNQLLPPLHDHFTPEQQRRWRDRLRAAEPWIVDLFRHGPEDPLWRSRAIDASALDIPAFFIAGWRDWFCTPMVRAYETVGTPRKLLIGPWGHDTPDTAEHEPVEHRGLLLDWWRRWLRDPAPASDDQAEVLLFEQGGTGRWREFPGWPRDAGTLTLSTTDSTTLLPDTGTRPADQVIGEAVSDPAIGAVSGVWGTLTADAGLPPDQHEDDVRGLAVTGEPLTGDLVIAGRPVVSVAVAEGSTFSRIVVRLTDVDPLGRSRLISAGTLVGECSPGSRLITLDPTCYRVGVGHRIRISLSDADFPWLWPTPRVFGEPAVLRVHQVAVSLPQLDDADGRVVTPARPPRPEVVSAGPLAGPWITVGRDIANGRVEIHRGYQHTAPTPDREHLVETSNSLTLTVGRAHPEAARAHGVSTAVVTFNSGERVVARVRLHMTRTSMTVEGQIDIDGTTTFSRRWSA